jgi:hypothetical protein
MRSLPISRLYPDIRPEELRKNTKKLRVVDVAGEIRTGDFPNTSQKRLPPELMCTVSQR